MANNKNQPHSLPLSIASPSIIGSQNSAINLSHSTVTFHSPAPKRPQEAADKEITEAISTIKNAYNEFERMKMIYLWNDDLIFEEDYITQEFIEDRQPLNGPNSISTNELLDKLRDKESDRFLVKGDFFTGKSTLCRYICHQWMCNKLDTFTLVMYLPLRSLQGSSVTMTAYTLLKSSEKCSYLEKSEFENFLRENGKKILLFLDGIDELSPEEKEPIFKILKKEDLSEISILATARNVPEHDASGCLVYNTKGVSKKGARNYLDSKLTLDDAEHIQGTVPIEVLCSPLILRFAAILAKRGLVTACPTAFHFYYKVLESIIEISLEKEIKGDKNRSGLKIKEETKRFIHQLCPIAYERLESRDIDDQRRIISFNSNFKSSVECKEEVFEFGLKPFAEVLAMNRLKEHLEKAQSRELIHSLLRLSSKCLKCGSQIGDEESLKRSWMQSKEQFYYLFSLLNEDAELCSVMFRYCLSRCKCNCKPQFILLKADLSTREQFETNTEMNGSVLVCILSLLSGETLTKCCQHFLDDCGQIWLDCMNDGVGRSISSSFALGLMALLKSTPSHSMRFKNFYSLLWIAHRYLQAKVPEVKGGSLEKSFSILLNHPSELDRFDNEKMSNVIQELSPHSDELKKRFKDYIKVECVQFRCTEFTNGKVMFDSIHWLVNTFGIDVARVMNDGKVFSIMMENDFW